MNITEKIESLDLNVSVPRSSKETMAGIAHLPRMIDKARSLLNDTLGEYIYPCPLDWHVLRHLEVKPENFANLAEVNDDNQMTEVVHEISRSWTRKERNLVNSKIINRTVDPEDLPSFLKTRNLIDPKRTDVTTWDGLIDLEEGHL
jgi:hypothetical protein